MCVCLYVDDRGSPMHIAECMMAMNVHKSITHNLRTQICTHTLTVTQREFSLEYTLVLSLDGTQRTAKCGWVRVRVYICVSKGLHGICIHRQLLIGQKSCTTASLSFCPSVLLPLFCTFLSHSFDRWIPVFHSYFLLSLIFSPRFSLF